MAKKTGRKPKYTPEMVKRVCDAVRMGATYELAAGYAGISETTFYEWKANKVEFSEALKEAEGTAAVGWLAKIEKAATDGHWQAAAWKLERRYPRDYGRTVTETENLNVDINDLTDEQLQQVAQGKSLRDVIRN